MICAISSGLSPSRSNLKVTIFLLCVSSWHSATLSPTLEICKTSVSCWISSVTKSLRQNMNELVSSNTYTENIELGLSSLLVAGAAADRSTLVTFHWAPFMATSWSSASIIAVTKTWSCIRQAAGREMDPWEQDPTHCGGAGRPAYYTNLLLTFLQMAAPAQTTLAVLLVPTEKHSQGPETQT